MVNPFDVQDISNGFRHIEAYCEEFIKNIPEQLAKFSSRVSVETFMNELGIVDYKLKKNQLFNNGKNSGNITSIQERQSASCALVS